MQEEGTAAQDAANVQWAGDRDRLLPGERPESQFRDDAEHWVRVYRELVAFNVRAMETITERLSSSPSPDGSGMPDLELLEAHLQRLRWRLSFWEGRAAQMREAVGVMRIAPEPQT